MAALQSVRESCGGDELGVGTITDSLSLLPGHVANARSLGFAGAAAFGHMQFRAPDVCDCDCSVAQASAQAEDGDAVHTPSLVCSYAQAAATTSMVDLAKRSFGGTSFHCRLPEQTLTPPPNVLLVSLGINLMGTNLTSKGLVLLCIGFCAVVVHLHHSWAGREGM